MKKTYFKLFAALMLLSFSVSFVSCSGNDDDPIENIGSYDDLPSAAKTFLNQFFYGYSVVKVEKETYGNMVMYEVDLQGGYEVMFNNAGEWQEVSAPDGETIPDGIVPENVQETLNQRYPDYGVNEINKTSQGYNVDLMNMQGGDSIELRFNMAGEIIATGDYY